MIICFVLFEGIVKFGMIDVFRFVVMECLVLLWW